MRSSHCTTRCGVLVAICSAAWLIHASGCSSTDPSPAPTDRRTEALSTDQVALAERAAPPQTTGGRPDGAEKNPGALTVSSDTQFRGLWVTTAYNQDWPSKDGMHRRLQRDEIAGLVKRAKDLNCNVIFLQVRAFGDRIQRETSLAADSQSGSSKFIYDNETWAVSLNGGNDPVPKGAQDKYDPLDEWIQQCQKAGIELHLWINPFRVNKPVRVWTKKPDGTKGTKYWLPLIEWKKQLYLDPNSKAVQDYVLAVIVDLLKHYKPQPDAFARAEDIRRGDKFMLVAGDGPEGVVYDHNLPPEPPTKEGPPATQPTTRTARDAAPVAVPAAARLLAAQPTDSSAPTLTLKIEPDHPPTSPAEKEVHKYWTMYWNDQTLHIPDDTRVTMKEFLDQSFGLVKDSSGRFGLSPMAKKGQDAFAYTMTQLQNDKVDYVIPELYAPPNLNDFDNDLKTWLNAVPKGNDPPIIVAGLNTARVQVPLKSDDAEPDWDAQKIEDQMQRVQLVRGNDNKRAAGEAHFSVGALRTVEQSGPEDPQRHIGRRLMDGRYREGRLPPSSRRIPQNQPLPDTPINFQPVNDNGANYVKWETPQGGGGRRPKKWIAEFLDASGNWGRPQVVGEPRVKIDPSVAGVRVWAVDKFNRRSDQPGIWP